MKSLSNPKRIQRIFKASEHGFKVSAFHERCDNKEDTLVLIKTEFGKVIGGFTHYPWTSDEDGEFVHDEAKKAFIFSMDMK